MLIISISVKAQNLIPNGGFDQGPNWSVEMKDHWPVDSACNGIDTVYLAGPDYWYSYGDASIRFVYGHPFIECSDNTIYPPSMPSWININDAEKVGVILTSPLKPGSNYKLSYYVKIDSVLASWFPQYYTVDTWAIFNFLNPNGNVLQSPTFTIQNNLHTWQQYDTVFTATTNSDVFEIWGADTIWTVLNFDNFELSEITSVEELQIVQQPTIYLSQGEIVIETYNYDEYNVSVYDVIGNCVYSKKVYKKDFIKIPSSFFNKGIYLVTVQSNNLMYSKKVFIN